MRKINITRCLIILPLATIITWFGCRQEHYSLGPKPQASFTITPIAGKANTYSLINTTPSSFNAQWNFSDNTTSTGDTVQKYFPFKGTYAVKLLVMGHGGYDTAVQNVTVAETDPDLCFGAFQALTDCGGKGNRTWKLTPIAGSWEVGPLSGSPWWSIGAGDIPGRACAYNDEWTFNTDGTFNYDDKGDFFVDDESGAAWPSDIGLPADACASSSQWPDKYKAWSSGTFRFVIDGSKLVVAGLGAHVGAYKIGEQNTASAPESKITYDIVSINATSMILKKTYSWGYWKFMLSAQ